jgi:SAM-dependent methyltransferase
MAAGLGPFVESFQLHAERLWDGRKRIRLLDIGGGDGTLAARLLPGTSGLLIDVYNLPAVRPLVEQTRSTLDHGHRLGFVGGDFLAQPLPAGYDALSFVRVLHDWPSATAQTLLRKAFEALTPGGRVIICEEFRNAERLAQQFFWSYFLIGVDGCSSMLREVAEYITILTTEGFTDIEVLPGPVEIIIATKPSSGTRGIDPADRYPARLFRGLG